MAVETKITLVAAVLAFCAAIISTVASLYSARFRRYAQERWWERKADAYTRIAHALSEMLEYYRMTYEVEIEGQKITPQRKAEFLMRWKNGWEEARRSTNMGTLLVSNDANKALRDLWRSFDHAADEESWIDRIEAEFASAEKCLAALVVAAKEDLQVPQ